MVSARAGWTVEAGIIPGRPEPKHTKTFILTSEEWSSEIGHQLLMQRSAEATAYACYLQLLCANGREVNWTRTDFVWF